MSRFDIPDAELQWTFSPSGGPGGQHANRSNTRAELTFDVASSAAFDDEVRDRIVAQLGETIRVVDDGSRSQTTNRRRALRRLHAHLDEAARPAPPPRRVRRPSPSQKRRRLDEKRRRSQRKADRRRPTHWE